jgi:uncharacterized protein (TIGR03000 family)
MFRQRFSIAAAVGGAILAWAFAAAPACADSHGSVHAGSYRGVNLHSGAFRGTTAYPSGYSAFHSGYGGYRGSYYGGYSGYGGGYYGGYRGYRGGYGEGGYRGGYYRGGLGLSIGALPYYTSSYYYTSPYYYTAPYYSSYNYTPPVVNYSPNYYVTPPATTTLVTPSALPSADDVSQAGYAEPIQAPTDARSHVEVVLPSADAEVLFNGNLTRQKGVDREFVSPPLTPGQTYHYTVEAHWMENGRQVAETRTVTVGAGQTATVDFTR